MEKERILITVKTYPTLSRKYGETVCTAGIREDGSWVRIYPVPFRRLDQDEQYKKYDWIEARLERNTSDTRPDSYRPLDQGELRGLDNVGTADGWRERRELVLDRGTVYHEMQVLIDLAHANELSLGVFKPAEVLDFIAEPDDPEWDESKVREMRELSKQTELFAEDRWRETFKLIPKLPYKFSYRFRDRSGRESKLRVLDWEVGALFANCLASANKDHAVALAKVRAVYFDTFTKRDLHFFVGTTQQWHQRGPNPWVIIGVFPPPIKQQLDLFGGEDLT